MLSVIQAAHPEDKNSKPKVTCITCQLKGCVGRCKWQKVGTAGPSKVA